MAGDMLPLDNPDPAKIPETKAKRVAAAAKSARKARKGERRSRGEVAAPRGSVRPKKADAPARTSAPGQGQRDQAPAARRRRARAEEGRPGQADRAQAPARQTEMTRLAIFDCDGTLVDSGAAIHAALGTALGAHGFDCPPPSVTRKVIGLSLDEAMAELVPDADHPALSRTYKDAFSAMRGAGQVEEPLYDGIADLLDAMSADGWLLGVATGKSDRGLRHCLAIHGLADRFVTLQTADRNPSKPHPAMALAAMAEAGAEPGEHGVHRRYRLGHGLRALRRVRRDRGRLGLSWPRRIDRDGRARSGERARRRRGDGRALDRERQ